LIAQHIEHPAIARPIAAALDMDCAYLAMEYAVGDSLDAATGRGPMPLQEVASIVGNVAAALDRGAELGVFHERLHPRDVIVSAEGARVTGLGIAEALSTIGMSMPVRRPYAAAERPSDVYSLAAIACELIAGRPMTSGGWDELSAEDGPELRNAFSAALSEDPRARPRPGDFAAMLQAAARSTVGRNRAADSVESGAYAASHGFGAELDVAGLARFADLGDAADLRMEFEPAPAATPLPPSWTAQPPKLFQAGEPEPQDRRRLKLAAAFLVFLFACFGGGYALSLRSARQSATAKASLTRPPVTSTTVELPPLSAAATEPAGPAAAAAPHVSTLPAPSPSRPASGAVPEPVRPATGHGRLLVRSTPAGASVSINGQGRGKTPLAVRDLPFGSYTIHLARDGYAAADRQERLTAKRPIASLAVTLKQARAGSEEPAPGQARGGESRGRIAVESRPSGARVFVNDRLAGSTPLGIPALPAGPAKVRIEMDGYRTWATTVDVKAGERTLVTASLDRR
jgi:hypothetical protein